MSEVTDSLLQRLRQLLAQDFKNAANQFTITADPRYLTPTAAAAAYQPLSANIAKLVYENGTLLSQPVISAGSTLVTSTGATGTYAISFPTVTFSGNPAVIAWCSKESGGSVVILQLDAVSTTLFQFDLFLVGGGAITAGHTVTVAWIAVGV